MNSLDWIIVIVYLALVFFIGLIASTRVKNILDYFLAGKTLPFVPVALSIIATEVSAATIIGAPDTAFKGNLAYLQTTIGAVLSRFFLAYFFIDVYYRHGVFTVYSFLAKRFGVEVQILTALLYSIARLLASAARLYIAGLAIGTIVGLDISLSIIAISTLGMVYCIKGGLRAVVWTEVLQSIVFLSVGAFAIFYVANSVGGLTNVANELIASNKLQLFDFNWNIFSAEFWLNPYTFVGAVIGGFTLGTATHGTDQDMVQRMLACRTSAEGKRSLVLAALLEIPTAVIFVLLGSALWVYYQQATLAAPPANDSVFPYFIRTVVPHGLKGLFVVAILAAAMSSLNSVLTALASVTVLDIARPLRELRGKSALESDELKASKLHSLLWGVALTVFAIVIGLRHQAFLLTASVNDPSRSTELLSLALGVMSVVYGPMLAIFLIGLFTTRGNFRSLGVGMFCGLALTTSLQFGVPFSIGWTWQTVIGCLITFVVGVMAKSQEAQIPAEKGT